MTVGGTAATNVVVVSATSITATTPAGTTGTANVVVTNLDTGAATDVGAFTYISTPTIASLSQGSGPNTGGTPITITGTQFASGATVTVGGTAATNVVVVSATSITATTPAGTTGTANVVVTNADTGTATNAGAFTYISTPTIASLSQGSGPNTGGTPITITGTQFASGATVTVGGAAAANVVVVSATSITATTPAGTTGTANVVVTNADTGAATDAGAFTYISTPTIASLSQGSGPNTGGTSITITGTQFASGATVTVGGAAAANVVVVSATSITATTPAGTTGTANVVVTNTDTGTATDVGAFTYISTPTIASVSPSSVTAMSATLGGDVTSDGDATITTRGVVYALTSDNANPQLNGKDVTNLSTSGTTGVFTVNATGLTPGATYSFAAYATNSVGTSYTSVSTFMAQVQTDPSGAIPTDVPLFSWVPLTGGVSEELAVVDLSTGGNLVLLVPIPSGTAYQLPKSQALVLGHYYTWYIGAVSSTGAIAWSGGTNFNVTPLGAPTPLGPAGTIMTSTGYDLPTFTWSSVPNAVQYDLYLQDASTGSIAVYNPNVSVNSFTPSQPLLAGHSYVWYVGAEGTWADAGPIAWSGPANSTITALPAPTPAAPVPHDPSGIIPASSGYDTPTFSWNNVPYAVNYYLYVQDAYTGAVVVANATLTANAYAPGPLLLAGHRYTWWIGSEAAAGGLGVISWSGAVNFTLAPLATPSNLATNFSGWTPRLIWDSVPGAAAYRLYVVDAVTGALVVDNSSLTVPSFAVTGGLTSGHRYTWYVAALGADGAAGPILERAEQLRRPVILLEAFGEPGAREIIRHLQGPCRLVGRGLHLTIRDDPVFLTGSSRSRVLFPGDADRCGALYHGPGSRANRRRKADRLDHSWCRSRWNERTPETDSDASANRVRSGETARCDRARDFFSRLLGEAAPGRPAPRSGLLRRPVLAVRRGQRDCFHAPQVSPARSVQARRPAAL